MEREVFSIHLLEFTPDIKRLVSSFKRKRFFGVYGDDDLVQEVMVRLWVKVPDLFDSKKGDLKKYCMCAAYNLLNRLANNASSEFRDISYDCYQKHDQIFDDNENLYEDKIGIAYIECSQLISQDCNRSVLFKLKIERLAEQDKDFSILKLFLEYDFDREKICNAIGRTNAFITQKLNKIRRKFFAYNLMAFDEVRMVLKNM